MSKASDAWWLRQGYSNEPGKKLNGVPKGVSPEAELLRNRFEAVAPDGPDEVYEPTSSSNPDDPRTAAMFYFKEQETVLVQWGDAGRPYYYQGITPGLWKSWKDAVSPGRWINRHNDLVYFAAE
jgi:hypothetical protein